LQAGFDWRGGRALTTVSLQTVARGAMTPLAAGRAAAAGRRVLAWSRPTTSSRWTTRKLITDAISGMVASLDPHSQYFDKKSFKEFREGTTGRFVGVGIEITQEDGLIKVVSRPSKARPPFRAGLKTNDLITKIDDTAVKGLSLNDAVKRMRGEPNTKVTLTILRKDENRTFPVTITREEIKTQSVKGKVIEPGYAGSACRSSRSARWTTLCARSKKSTSRTPTQGLGAGPAQRPGRPAGCGRGHFGGLPARERHRGQSTNGQLAESKAPTRPRPSSTSAAAAGDPLKRLPARSRRCRWWCWSTKARHRPAKSWPAPCRTTSAPPSWAARPLARARCRPCARWARHRPQAHHRRYYTPSGKSIQAKGIVPDVMIDESEEGNVFAALRMREADLDKHLGSGQGEEKKDEAREKAREEARKRLEEEAKKPA
jgi:carboxyl-terminal processing protease